MRHPPEAITLFNVCQIMSSFVLSSLIAGVIERSNDVWHPSRHTQLDVQYSSALGRARHVYRNRE
jgi:hypothetical protein